MCVLFVVFKLLEIQLNKCLSRVFRMSMSYKPTQQQSGPGNGETLLQQAYVHNYIRKWKGHMGFTLNSSFKEFTTDMPCRNDVYGDQLL